RGSAPDGTRRRTEVEDVVAPTILDGDRGIERLRPGTEVIFPHNLARPGLQGEDEASAGAALVARKGGHDLLQRPAADDQLAGGEERRGEEGVGRVGPGTPLAPRFELPPLLSGRPIQRVEPTADVAEADGVSGDQRRAQDAFGGRLEAS